MTECFGAISLELVLTLVNFENQSGESLREKIILNKFSPTSRILLNRIWEILEVLALFMTMHLFIL